MIPDREIPFKVSESILRTWIQMTLCGKILRPVNCKRLIEDGYGFKLVFCCAKL